MSVTKTFDKDYLVDELDLPWNCVDRWPVDSTRWSTIREGVAEIDGEFWRFSWSEGATEMQDEAPWEYESEVLGTKVERREVLVEQWAPVEE